jgi:hypothetical protein
MNFLHIWERDFLEMAKRYPNWRALAHNLGFRDEKIDAVWVHSDEGRRIEYTALKDWASGEGQTEHRK